uniref:Aspartyl/glutamyl-tRNA(Asn/Gln) amidotransferase subunit C n=1 Tax=Candidatus Kentrum sp. FW TaxID=2126338 RepID=A0A450TEB3_9GAMM|nr:MAG: aspartyl/glutamyl-tRNA(Asn/Gln) amidotransferase subunit C [Candidatus Kentron sp. FW]
MGKVEIEKIAHLACLTMESEDIVRYARDLSNILALVKQMEEVDTTKVVPMAHPLDTSQRLRLDMITEIDQRAHFQKNAQLVDAGLYLVPKVIK